MTISESPSKVTFPVPDIKLSLFVQFPATFILLLAAFRVPSIIVNDPFTSKSSLSVIVPEVLRVRL